MSKWSSRLVAAVAVLGVAVVPLATQPALAAGPTIAKSVPRVTWVPNSGVHALAQDATWIYLGGTFTSLTNPSTKATQSMTRLARVSISTGALDTTWKPTVDGDVRALVADPTTKLLYVGGSFTHVNGTVRNRLAAVSTTGAGALTSFNPITNGTVRAIEQLDATTLLVAGFFTQVGGATHHYLVKMSTSGAINGTFKPNVAYNVYSISRPPGSNLLLIGGTFLNVGGLSRQYLAQLNLTTGAPTSWYPGNPCGDSDTHLCTVFSIVTTATDYYTAVAGTGGRTFDYDPTTARAKWTAYGDGDNQALALTGSFLYVGGHFGPSFGGGVRATLAAVDATTGRLNPSFAPTAATSYYPGVQALMTTPSGALVEASDVKHIGGTADNYFAYFPTT